MRKEQKKVSEFISSHGLKSSAETRCMDMLSELGELSKEILKTSDYGKKPAAFSAGIQDEMGDCLFSLLALCDALEVDAEKALDGALQKYTERFEKKGDIASGR